MHSRKYLYFNQSIFPYMWTVLNNRLPPIEAIMEILVSKADPAAGQMLKEEPLCIVNDMSSLLTGYTISYLEFSQGMCQNKTLLRDIYEPVFSSHAISKLDQLKEIAAE